MIKKLLSGIMILVFITLSTTVLAASTNINSVRLTGVIDDSEYEGTAPFTILQEVLALNVGDKLYIYIDSPGGRLDVGVPIMNAIKNTKGTVVGILDGEASSMAAEILITCQEIVVAHPENKNSYVMVHSPYIRVGRYIIIHGMTDIKEFERLQRIRWTGILTEKELNSIYNRWERKDIFIKASDFKNRICTAVHKGC